MVGPTQFHWKGVVLISLSAGFPAQFFEPSFGLLEGDQGYNISYMIADLYLPSSSRGSFCSIHIISNHHHNLPL